jgi:hypothetical protein
LGVPHVVCALMVCAFLNEWLMDGVALGQSGNAATRWHVLYTDPILSIHPITPATTPRAGVYCRCYHYFEAGTAGWVSRSTM